MKNIFWTCLLLYGVSLTIHIKSCLAMTQRGANPFSETGKAPENKQQQKPRRPKPPLMEKPNLVEDDKEEKNTDTDFSRGHDRPLSAGRGGKPAAKKRRGCSDLCRMCQEMYVLSEKEYEEMKDSEQFCVRLKQVRRCIRRLRKEQTSSFMFFMFFTAGVRIQTNKHDCNKRNVTADDLQSIFMDAKEKAKAKWKNDEVSIGRSCRYQENNTTVSRLAHCGLFGDPHLKTFFGARQTCVVEGDWVLVDNEFMKVQVTNEMVQNLEVPRATATKKISITFKERDLVCSEERTYDATTQYLPEAFSDGTRTNGPQGCLTTISKQNQDAVTIKTCRSNTTIIVRRVGHFLTFNIVSPFRIANSSSGLCNGGCPANELVDYSSFFMNRIHQNDVSGGDADGDTFTHLSHYQAMELCARRNVTDFYYDSCVFDLLTTGKRQFSMAAKLAMQDALRMDPSLRLRRDNSFVLKAMHQQQTFQSRSSSASRLNLSITFIVLLISWCTLLLR